MSNIVKLYSAFYTSSIYCNWVCCVIVADNLLLRFAFVQVKTNSFAFGFNSVLELLILLLFYEIQDASN